MNRFSIAKCSQKVFGIFFLPQKIGPVSLFCFVFAPKDAYKLVLAVSCMSDRDCMFARKVVERYARCGISTK